MPLLSRLDQEFAFTSQALKLRGYRQQLLASNIANADTPNYKSVDFNFEKELKRVADKQSGNLPLHTTHAGHQSPQNGNPLGVHVQYRTDVQTNLDGNSVNLDVERAKMAENAFRYENMVRTISGQVRGLISAIRG